MNSRQLVESYGITTGDLVTLTVQNMGDLTLTDLQYLLMHIELEISYREDTDQLGDK